MAHNNDGTPDSALAGFDNLVAAAGRAASAENLELSSATFALLAVAEQLRISNLIALRQIDMDEESTVWLRQIGSQVRV